MDPELGNRGLGNRVALVTGASRGIGRAIALRLAEAGAAVGVNYQSHADQAEHVVAAIRAEGGRATAVAADVSGSRSVIAMVRTVEESLGPIDVLVNNAGIAVVRDVDDISEADWDLTLSVNLKSAFLCTRAVLTHMRDQRWGRIVNISSGAARGGGIIGVHYNAAKAGLEGLTRGYAARLAKDGVTVNAVAPTLIATDMIAPGEDAVRRVPMGRLGLPEEIAQAVLMVIGNAYMTGQTIAVNGGTAFV
jgi:3-oxoacyl-[acyl-carrier protein] reductase